MKIESSVIKESLFLGVLFGIFQITYNYDADKATFITDTLLDSLQFFIFIFIGRSIVVNFKKHK